ncbi:ZmpA/ZmpB/ZmpC family metallo-endopeptidase [Abiotrophia defectiva]|uniref:ZmpA/ZmpB/ZmpC family metallo-endopeptidase n=1 Tax=Abiotrophia defectiva TaxID=46125 RepID=UPI0028D459AB|nr:ZmpA/ZmpB/ZmpC family metallo-endopeptidase [Abiotrophia defectiva]
MKFKGKHQRPNQIQRFSIRKFSVGIASVVIGSFFMGTIAPISVQAQESTSSQYVASAPTLSSITTSYQYVALQELTPAQQQAILSGTPSDIAQADQVYYFVYRPIESKQVLPATGEAAPLFGAMAGALTLIVAVGLIRDRKKTIMTLMVVSSLGQILSTSATLALESRLLNRYNQVFYSQQGDHLPDPRIHIEGYEYVGYFAQATLNQANNTLPQSSESSSQVQSNEEVSSEEPSSQVASESSSSSPANAVVTSSVASSESSASTSDLSSSNAESSSESPLSSESEASLSQSSEVTVSESSSQSSESSQPIESTQSSAQPVSSEPAESESSQAVISQSAESSSQVESTPQPSSEASSQNQTPNPAESSSEAPTPTPQPEPPKPLNYAAWQANLEQAQASWQVLANDDLSGKTPKSVKAYNDALASLKQDYQALVEAMTSLQASGAVSQPEIDQLTSKMTGIIARQVALPDTLVKRADQTPLITQSDNLANLVKTLNATDLSQKTPASVQALKEQIKFAQAALQNGGSVLKDGDATEADIDAMTQNLANQLKSLQDAQAALQDRADLSVLKEALNQLTKPVNTDGKTPKSVKQFEAAKAAYAERLAELTAQANAVQEDPNASQEQVDTVVAKVQAFQQEVSQAQELLVDQTDKKVLTQTKADLDQLLASEPDLSNKTPKSVAAYRQAKEVAQRLTQEAAQLLANLDASPMEVLELNEQLNQAQEKLRTAETAIMAVADKESLRQAKQALAKKPDTTGKTPKSVAAYQAQVQALARELAQADDQAQAVLDDANASPAEVEAALAQVQAQQEKLDQAAKFLKDKANKTALEQAIRALETDLAQEVEGSNKTPFSLALYRQKQEEARDALEQANRIVQDLDASPQEVATAVEEVNQSKAALQHAKENLRDQAGKATLHKLLEEMVKPVSTEGKTPKSVQEYQTEYGRHRAEIDAALAKGAQVAEDKNATEDAVQEAISALEQALERKSNSQLLLVNQVDKTALRVARQGLQDLLSQKPDLSDKTPASIRDYQEVLEEAETELDLLSSLIEDPNTAEDKMNDALAQSQTTKANLRAAIAALTPKADKVALEQALSQINQPIDLAGKTPNSVTAFEEAKKANQVSRDQAIQKAQDVMLDENATPEAVSQALTELKAAQAKLDQARAKLVNQSDKSALKQARAALDTILQAQADLTNKTPQSIGAYERARQAAQAQVQDAQAIIADANATPSAVAEAVNKIKEAQASLKAAQEGLTNQADKTKLVQALATLKQPISTEGKTPKSIQTFNQARNDQLAQVEAAKNEAERIIANQDASPEQVSQALQAIQEAQSQINQAKALLVNQADKSALEQAKQNLDTAIQATPNLTNKTPQSVQAYEQAKANAQAAVQAGQAIIADLNASPEAVEAAKTRITQAQAALKAAQDNLRDKANKAGLQSALNALNAPISTSGKTPNSVRAFEQAQAADKATTDQAKAKAKAVISDENATEAQVAQALQAVRDAQTKVDTAKALLVNQADKSALEQGKQNLDTAIQAVPNLANKTPQSVQTYEQAKANAQAAVQAGQVVITDLNASPEAVEAAKTRITQAQAALKAAQDNLRDKANKAGLQSALNALNAPISTVGKTPRSIDAFRTQESGYQSELDAAKQTAQSVLADENATASQVAQALEQVQEIQAKVNAAKNLLVDQADKSALTSERTKLQNEVAKAPDLANKTPQSIATYEAAKAQADAALAKALSVQNDLNATPAQVQEAVNQLKDSHTALTAAKAGLQTKADKQALIAALNKLNAPIATDGKTPASITAYRNSLTANQSTINQVKAQAQAMIANENASQVQVNEALQAIKSAQVKIDEAKNKLVDQANKQALQASIVEAGPLVENHYTPASWQALQTQLSAAKQVNQDPNASQSAVDSAKQALDQAIAQLVMHTPRFTSQEVVLPTDELSRSVTVNYTLFDPANKYQSAQVKVYQGDQLVQTVAINNNQAVINGLNYEVPYRLVTELTYADKSGVSKTDPQLSEELVELKLKKFELKQIKEEGLYQVEGQELKRVSALASVPQDLSGYLVKVSSDRYKDVVLKVAAIEATTYNGEDYYQVTATAPELVQNNGGTTDYHQSHQFLVRKAAPAVNNVYHSFGELLTAMKANLSGTFILGSNVSAADVVLAKGQEAYLMDTFRGKLLGRGADGQSHAIFDLKAPLFKETNQATISNLDLKRVDIRDRDNVGSLAVVANQTTITDVTASGRLSGSQSIGGLVATVLGGSQLSQVGFKGSIESMAFNGANSTIGGIVANLEKGSITQATADINMHLSSGNENSRYGGLVGAVGSGSSLTKAVVKGNIWNSGSGVLRRWGSSTGGAVGSTWSNSRIDQVISETKVDNGRIFFGHRNAEQQESTRRSFSNIAVVQDVASGIEQEFLKDIETISPQEAASRQQAMGITVSFDDSSDAVTTLSKESLMTDYTAMPNYKADKAQAYANMEKLLPFYNKEQIIKYGNLATGKLASQVLVSVTPMMGSNYVTDYSQPMDRIMLHYADKSVQYLGLAAKSNFKQTGIVEYKLEDSGLIYTPNQIQQTSIESMAQDLAAQLSTTDLYSDKMFELLGIKDKNYVNDKVKQTRKDALQKTLGRVPTDEELQADLDAVNQAERIKDVKRLYLEDTMARLKPNLTDAVKKVLKQSLNQAIDGGHSGLEAQLKQQVLDNKEALLLGLLYMHRHYEIKFGEANIGDISTYQADFFGKSENVLDKLIYLGSRGINALHTKHNFRAYAAFISPDQAVGNLLDYLDYFRETLTDLDENAWFRQATQQNLVLEERASREAGLANKEYRIYPRLKARSVQNYILPLLNLKDSTLFAISTVNGFTWGSLDRRSYDRQRLEELVNLMANRQQTHLDTWYRMALPAVKDRIANNPGNQTWDGYKDATGQWFGEFGESNAKGNAPKNPSMGIREFFGPIGRYFGANGSAAYADTISNIYFIHTDMLNDYNGASIWTHELVHLQDRSINLGGYGWRPDERFEQYPQGLLQAPENPSTINHMGINTIFDYSNEKLRYYNESPDRFQTAADVHEYVHGVFDVLYTLDYAEGLDVLARGKDFWKKMYNQVTNEADGVHANNLIKELTDQEWENINLTSINDLVEHQLVVKRGYGAKAKYNRDNYVTINMYAPNYATGENTTGSPGGLMFKRMAWEMMAYKGYEDGFVPYASDKLQKEAKAAGNAELSDTYVIKSVSGGEFQNMTVFKQAMFKERIDKLNQSLIPITVNGTQVRTFADIQQLIHQAMEADIKANLLTRGDNNVHKVKKEIYRQYLLATNDFRTSIFQGQ